MAKLKPSQLFVGLALGIVGLISYVAYRTRHLSTPRRRWRRFHRLDAVALPEEICKQLEGVYSIEEGKDFFGSTAVVKYSYTIERRRKWHHLSFFCQKNGTYFVCEGRERHAAILFYGVWRKAAANGAGIVQLVMNAAAGSSTLLYHKPLHHVVLSGAFGNNNKKPHQPLVLHYRNPLPENRSFEIIGHRGASRNVDFLPVSENSLDMMKQSARLGATGVEIDVRMTKDNIPVIFHDSFLSLHTVKGKIYGGLVHNYTLKELKRLRLRKGGKIPTLEECLRTIVHQTPLQTVWLDVKKECDFRLVVKLQQKYMQQAAAIGRTLAIYIGIPDTYVLKCFTQLENYKDLPSLTELSANLALEINANVWAPQYTSGFQREKVAKIQAAGGKAFVWSLDNELLIDLYITEGGFDGLVTNAPPVVAHWYYVYGHRLLKAPGSSTVAK